MKKNRRAIEVANPRPGAPKYISRKRADEHCRNGVAYLTRDGRLRFGEHNPRQGSDVYVTGTFELRIVNTRRAECGPVFPHLQWMHYSKPSRRDASAR
jgi:hypothetical protein